MTELHNLKLYNKTYKVQIKSKNYGKKLKGKKNCYNTNTLFNLTQKIVDPMKFGNE